MLDVHPPHTPTHTWRDFFIHIATIVVGLLIAVGLEQTVEYFHHRHIIHQARENIHAEILSNQALIAKDREGIRITAAQMQQDIQLLQNPVRDPSQHLKFSVQWNGTSRAAYDTARDTGALALMPYAEVQAYAGAYNQQAIVLEQATLFLRDETASYAPISSGNTVADVPADKVKVVSDNCEKTLGDLHLLDVLLNGLDENYTSLLAPN